MPPTRSPSTFKAVIAPVTNERSHSENQERAYIAASRRNDRSLEARVQSAQRASEVHKQRTGRALRVTEEHVLNEEMYEEEDNYLPLQYHRLAGHLHTSSAFNRRLAAYLTDHVAMRQAFNEAVHSYENSSQYLDQPTSQEQWHSPNGQNFPQSAYQAQSADITPLSPGSCRQSPYPSPFSLGYLHQDHRSASDSSRQGSIESLPVHKIQANSEDQTTYVANKRPKLNAETGDGAKTPASSSSSTDIDQPKGRSNNCPFDISIEKSSEDDDQGKPDFNTSAFETSKQGPMNPFSINLPREPQPLFPPYVPSESTNSYCQHGSLSMPSKVGRTSQTLAPASTALSNPKAASRGMQPNISTTHKGDFNYSYDPSAPSSGFDLESHQNFSDGEFENFYRKTGDNTFDCDQWDGSSGSSPSFEQSR